MASATPASSKSSTRIQWMWNASPDPFSKSQPAEWKHYSDADNMIIEEAFQTGQKHAVLDNYSIDFKRNIQILNSDRNKQHLVQRKMCDRDDHHLCEERFTFTPINPKRPFGGLYGWISPFIKEVVKYLNITNRQLPSKDASIVPMVVEKAAVGIIEEGKKIGKQREAEHIATKLRQKKDAGIKEVCECCAHLYSLESFLYKSLNETMRLIGSEEHEQNWRNNIRTLGPFCLLLWDNPSNYKKTEKGTILYRGAKLSNEQVSAFKDDCSKEDKPIRSFPPFTSCSRNQAKVEVFGNVLFIMTVKHASTMDFQPFAAYPDEEEELLSPGVCFTVDRVEKVKNKHLIYLKLVQQYRRDDKKQTASTLRNLANRLGLVSSITGTTNHIATPRTSYRPHTGLTTRTGITSNRPYAGITSNRPHTGMTSNWPHTGMTSNRPHTGIATRTGLTSSSTISTPTSALSSAKAAADAPGYIRYLAGYDMDPDRQRATGAVYGGTGRTFAGCYTNWK